MRWAATSTCRTPSTSTGQIITVFDPVVHERCPTRKRISGSVIKAVPRDRRWIRIKRPVVIVGGELTLEMLDLTFNPISKFHEAPLQMKANGGVLLVDDFGRQRMRPEDLLNRWIVPLESRVDYLSLHTGKKIQVPFDVLIVFATNLDPLSLADEAFLRRIPYKIEVSDPSVELFTQIFEMNCRRRRLPFHKVLVAYLQRRHYFRTTGRCARVTRATSSTRSRRSAGIEGRSLRSRGNCSMRRATRISSTPTLPPQIRLRRSHGRVDTSR